MTPVPNPLPYAPRQVWHKRKRYRRAFWLVVLGVCAGIGWSQRESLSRRSSLIYWQWQCGHYSAAPSQIVYFTDDAGTVYNLLNATTSYRVHRESSNELDADQTVDAWNRLRELAYGPSDNTVGGLFGGGSNAVPPRSHRIITALTSRKGPAVLFLHDRQSSDGHSRLVVVTIWTGSGWDNTWHLTAMSTETNLFGGLGPLKVSNGVTMNRTYPNPDEPGFVRDVHSACFYAGQATATDRSRFTIAYELDGEEGIVDGLLTTDGDVKLTVRDGPATRPGRQTPTVKFVTPPDLTPLT